MSKTVHRFDDEEPVTPRQLREADARARTPRKPLPPPVASRRTRKTAELKAIRESMGK